MKSIKELARPNVFALYNEKKIDTTLRDLENDIFLDKNEIPYNNTLSRYSFESNSQLNVALTKTFSIASQQLLATNGSVEAIDLLFRSFCTPQQDNVICLSPTRSFYSTCSLVNDVELKEMILDASFQLSHNDILKEINDNTKICFITSPNAISGVFFDINELKELLNKANCLVVVDESYGYYSEENSCVQLINNHPNLIVVNSMSRTWGYASLRIGCVIAQADIISLLKVVQLPHTISQNNASKAISVLSDRYEKESWMRIWVPERNRLMQAFALLKDCERVYTTGSNYFLVKFTNSLEVYRYLQSKGIKVKYVDLPPACEDCIRISVGTKTENSKLLSTLRQY